MKTRVPYFAILVLGVSTFVLAHHAMEFIELESYQTAPEGAYVFHLHHDYLVDDIDQPGLDHWELTPGLSYGFTSRFMVDAHTHFAKFGPGHLVGALSNSPLAETGPSPFLEALALSAQIRLSESWPVGIAFIVGYEHPFQHSVEWLGGEAAITGAVVLSRGFREHGNLLINLDMIYEAGKTSMNWGIGLRNPLTPNAHGIAAGIELLANDQGDISLLPGIYFPLGMQDIVFKTGLEFDLDGNATRSNLTLMYLF